MSVAAPPRSPPPRPVAPERPPEQAVQPTPARDVGAGLHVDDVATLCLFLVTTAAAVGANRMFTGSSALPYLVGAAAAAHGLAWAGRRLALAPGLSSLMSGVASLLLTAWFVVPGSTAYGVPTLGTFRALSDLAEAGRAGFATAVAPTPPTAGFLAGCVVAVSLAAFLADWAAFRMRTAFEACVPAFALFVLASILGAARGRTAATLVFLTAAGLFLLVQLAVLDADRANWFAGRSAGATGYLVGVGASLVAGAAVLSLVLAPALPGYGAKAIIPTKNERGGPSNRETVSPLVTIHSRLVNLGQQVVFTVRSSSPSYWRLTSLDRFDGDVWSISSETYSETSGRLGPPRGGPQPSGPSINAAFEIAQLDSLWLPVPYLPIRARGVQDVSYNAGSGSLITAEATSNGLAYEVQSVKPDPSAAQLAGGPAGVPDSLEPYLQVPAVSARVRALARQIVAGADNPYERALALQNHFRNNFKYSLQADPGHSTDALENFLFESKAGYCEQFAGSYGLLARLVGLPARVAVGFRPGTLNPDGSYTVRDADAHAWPEVWFPGAGWVDFEPTPSVLSPTGSNHTGLPAEQPTPTPDPGTSPSTPDTTISPSGPEPGTSETTVPSSEGEASDEEAAEDGGAASLARRVPLLGLAIGETPSLLLAVFVLVVAGLMVIGGVPAAVVGGIAAAKWRRRDRRRSRAGSPEARIELAWREAQESMAAAGLERRPSETLGEYRARLASPSPATTAAGLAGGGPGLSALGRLGACTAQSAYAPPAHLGDLASRAEEDRDAVLVALDNARSRWQRLKLAADPRPLLSERDPASTTNSGAATSEPARGST